MAHRVQNPQRNRDNGRPDRTPFGTSIPFATVELNDAMLRRATSFQAEGMTLDTRILEDVTVIGTQAEGHYTSERHLNASHTEVYHYYNHHWFKILIFMDLFSVSGLIVRAVAFGLDVIGGWYFITSWLIIFLPSSALYTGFSVVLTKHHAKIGNAIQRRFHIQQSVQRKCIIAFAYIDLLGVMVLMNFDGFGVGAYIPY